MKKKYDYIMVSDKELTYRVRVSNKIVTEEFNQIPLSVLLEMPFSIAEKIGNTKGFKDSGK